MINRKDIVGINQPIRVAVSAQFVDKYYINKIAIHNKCLFLINGDLLDVYNIIPGMSELITYNDLLDVLKYYNNINIYFKRYWQNKGVPINFNSEEQLFIYEN